MNVVKGAPKHDAYAHTWKVEFYSFRNELGRHFARRHAISAIGHGVGHIDDIDHSSAFDGAATLIVGLLRSNRFILVESQMKCMLVNWYIAVSTEYILEHTVTSMYHVHN